MELSTQKEYHTI